MFVDIHTHFRTPSHKGIAILDISDGKTAGPHDLCSLGLHPLHITEGSSTDRLKELVAKGRLVAVGEAGLDRRASAGMGVQRALFEQQVRIAEAYGLPLIIHCVRSFPELIAIHKAQKPKQPWIIHGYNTNKEVLRQLLQLGLYISAGKALADPRSNIREMFVTIPVDRLFLETDDAACAIGEVYHMAAALLGVETEELERRLSDNFAACFPALCTEPVR